MKLSKHIPEDYRYRETPEWAIHSASGDTYRPYCKWLASHLCQHEFTLSTAQAAYAESLQDKTPEGIAISLADTLGFFKWEKDLLDMWAREGIPDAEIEKRELEEWQENITNYPDIDEPFEEIKTTQEEYERICREVEEMDRIGYVSSHADIPIRPLLALAVRKCRDAAHAEYVIKLFYETFNDVASK